jgi:acetyl esterase/lipase
VLGAQARWRVHEGTVKLTLVQRYDFERAPSTEAADVEAWEVTIAGRHGDVPARAYRSRSRQTGEALVWVHGGGFIAGDLDMPEAHWVGVELARRGIPVLSVEYRKCLEGVHYPIPSDDILDAWLFVAGHEDEFSVASGHLHLGGASAGANLVAGVTKRLRDSSGPLPASLLLAYPLLHAELPPFGEELRRALAARGPDLFTPEVVHALNLNFAGCEEALLDIYAFPANGDASGLPPVSILNCEADSLRASGEAFAAQLAAAGVRVRVAYEPESTHGHLNDPDDPTAERSLERIAEWLVTGSGGR